MPPADAVEVDTDRLRDSAKLFDKWSQNLLAVAGELTGLAIEPGAFPAATELKNTVADRSAKLTTNVTDFSDALKGIAANLRDMADDYDATEDDNRAEADRVGQLIDTANAKLDGK
jgi:hypothetical protein